MSYPPPTDTPPHPAPARPRPWLWIGAVALALVAGAGGALALSDRGDGAPAEQNVAPAQGPAAVTTALTTPTTSEAATPAPVKTPPLSAVKLSPQVLDQQCFGSAGCSVDFEVKLDWDGERVPEGTSWRVTFEVTGIDDAPLIGVFQLTHDRFDKVIRSVETSGPKAKIRIRATLIELES